MRTVNQPESWWGWHGWNHPEPLSIVEIMQAGTLTPRLAAAFWIGFEHGASFIFAADPPGAGKTTILTALLAFAPPDMLAYFTRGWGETFDLPPPSDEYPTYLMVNEMSDHLPVYSWGPYVARTFELLGDGYSLCTTMHADDVEGVIDQLQNDAGVPAEHLARLTFVVPLTISRANEGTRRRVSDVALFDKDPGGYAVRSIASWDGHRDAFSVLEDSEQLEALATRLGLEGRTLERELSRREKVLERLVSEGISEISAVEQAVEAFRAHSS
jgi:hypothetical protein